MSTPATPRIEIDYWSEGFPASSPVNNGDNVLTTNWNELLWAAVTVGRPNRQYVFRHGDSSRYEALLRWSLTRMALEQRGPSARRLRRTNAFRTLDPSEKGAVSYFLGMTLCKLFSARLLDAPWAMHLDVFRPLLNPVLRGRSRPDLVAEINSGGWVALESKGRVSTPNDDAKGKAKQQALRLISVNGSAPRFHIGGITYFRNDVLQFFWRDPEPGQEQPRNPFELTPSDGIWRYYYQPVFELIRSHLHSSKQTISGQMMEVEGLDIQIGVHPLVFKHLSRDQWGDAKRLCIDLGRELHQAGYQADGVRVVAGHTWVSPFSEF